MHKSLLLFVTMACFTFGCNRSNVREASQEFNQLPPAVQQVVRSKAVNAEIAAVEKHTRNGQTTYLIQFRDSKQYPAMEVAADGKLVKYEAGTVAMGQPGPQAEIQKGSSIIEPSLSALPLGVQQAIVANAPRADVMNVRRVEENGRVLYEIQYAGNKPRPVLYVSPDGEIVKMTRGNSGK